MAGKLEKIVVDPDPIDIQHISEAQDHELLSTLFDILGHRPSGNTNYRQFQRLVMAVHPDGLKRAFGGNVPITSINYRCWGIASLLLKIFNRISEIGRPVSGNRTMEKYPQPIYMDGFDPEQLNHGWMSWITR